MIVVGQNMYEVGEVQMRRRVHGICQRPKISFYTR